MSFYNLSSATSDADALVSSTSSPTQNSKQAPHSARTQNQSQTHQRVPSAEATNNNNNLSNNANNSLYILSTESSFANPQNNNNNNNNFNSNNNFDSTGLFPKHTRVTSGGNERHANTNSNFLSASIISQPQNNNNNNAPFPQGRYRHSPSLHHRRENSTSSSVNNNQYFYSVAENNASSQQQHKRRASNSNNNNMNASTSLLVHDNSMLNISSSSTNHIFFDTHHDEENKNNNNDCDKLYPSDSVQVVFDVTPPNKLRRKLNVGDESETQNFVHSHPSAPILVISSSDIDNDHHRNGYGTNNSYNNNNNNNNNFATPTKKQNRREHDKNKSSSSRSSSSENNSNNNKSNQNNNNNNAQNPRASTVAPANTVLRNHLILVDSLDTVSAIIAEQLQLENLKQQNEQKNQNQSSGGGVYCRISAAAKPTKELPDLDDITTKFLVQHGIKGVAWGAVKHCDTEAMSTAGLSEATMYRVKVKFVGNMPPIFSKEDFMMLMQERNKQMNEDKKRDADDDDGDDDDKTQQGEKENDHGRDDNDVNKTRRQMKNHVKNDSTTETSGESSSSNMNNNQSNNDKNDGRRSVSTQPPNFATSSITVKARNELGDSPSKIITNRDNDNDEDEDDEEEDMMYGDEDDDNVDETYFGVGGGVGHSNNNNDDDDDDDDETKNILGVHHHYDASKFARNHQPYHNQRNDKSLKKRHHRKSSSSRTHQKNANNNSGSNPNEKTSLLSNNSSASKNNNGNNSNNTAKQETSSSSHSIAGSVMAFAKGAIARIGSGLSSLSSLSSGALSSSSSFHEHLHQFGLLYPAQVGDAVPPSTFIIKHYDTTEVRSPNALIRIMRLATHLTAEHMAKCEVQFYTLIRPLLSSSSSCSTSATNQQQQQKQVQYSSGSSSFSFRAPHCYFVSENDMGEPSCLKYVCCKCGAGSTVTLGLEDVSGPSSAGYSFAHIEGEGIAEFDIIQECVHSLAHLHSIMWRKAYRSGPGISPYNHHHQNIESSSINNNNSSKSSKNNNNNKNRNSNTTTTTAGSRSAPSTTAAGSNSQQQQQPKVSNTSPGMVLSSNSNNSTHNSVLENEKRQHQHQQNQHQEDENIISNKFPETLLPESYFQPDPLLAQILGSPPIYGVVHHHVSGALFQLPSRFDQVDLDALVKEWAEYFPLLQLKCVLAAAMEIQSNWTNIRERALRILSSRQTIVHGDFHFKNLAVRPGVARTETDDDDDDEVEGNRQEKKYCFKNVHETTETTKVEEETTQKNFFSDFDFDASHDSTRPRSKKPSPKKNHDQEANFCEGEFEKNKHNNNNDKEKGRICAVDYQGCGAGSALCEVAYFMGTSLPCEILSADKCDPVLYLQDLTHLHKTTGSIFGIDSSSSSKSNHSSSTSSTRASSSTPTGEQNNNVNNSSSKNTSSTNSRTSSTEMKKPKIDKPGQKRDSKILTKKTATATSNTTTSSANTTTSNTHANLLNLNSSMSNANLLSSKANPAPKTPPLNAQNNNILHHTRGETPSDDDDNENDEDEEKNIDSINNNNNGDEDVKCKTFSGTKSPSSLLTDKNNKNVSNKNQRVLVSCDSFGANPLRSQGVTASRPVTPSLTPKYPPSQINTTTASNNNTGGTSNRPQFPSVLNIGTSTFQLPNQNNNNVDTAAAAPSNGSFFQLSPNGQLPPSAIHNTSNLIPVNVDFTPPSHHSHRTNNNNSPQRKNSDNHSHHSKNKTKHPSHISSASSATATGGIPVSSNAALLDFTSFATLQDMRNFDSMVLLEYWNSLGDHVKCYDYENKFENLQQEFDVLVDNWFGMLLLDMSKSSVFERKQMKAEPDLQKMMIWAEKTSARVMLMGAAKRDVKLFQRQQHHHHHQNDPQSRNCEE